MIVTTSRPDPHVHAAHDHAVATDDTLPTVHRPGPDDRSSHWTRLSWPRPWRDGGLRQQQASQAPGGHRQPQHAHRRQVGSVAEQGPVEGTQVDAAQQCHALVERGAVSLTFDGKWFGSFNSLAWYWALVIIVGCEVGVWM
jgi:hypothetical protein